LCSAEEDTEAFSFHRRVKAADGGYAILGKHLYQIVSLLRQRRGALSGAEDRQPASIEDLKIPHRGQEVGSVTW
jgi:hypothetical protein